MASQDPRVARLVSLALFAIGIYLVKSEIVDVLDAARHHVPAIRYGMKATVMGPFAMFLGTLTFATSFTKGGMKYLVDPKTERPRPLGWVLVVAVIGLCACVDLSMRAALQGYGYHV